MHRSRLGAVIIDCQTNNLEEAAEFWSQALGCPTVRSTDPADKNYIGIKTEPNEIHIEVQRVEHPSRVHIDVETDNIEEEVGRLESLGAKRVQQIRSWWVMEAPTGHRFCVVRPQRSEFATEANEWD